MSTRKQSRRHDLASTQLDRTIHLTEDILLHLREERQRLNDAPNEAPDEGPEPIRNIELEGSIKLKTSLPTSTNMPGGLWTEDILFRHLEFVLRTVPMDNEVLQRLMINPFVFRALDIIKSGIPRRMALLIVEHVQVPSATVSDQRDDDIAPAYIDLVSIVTSCGTSLFYLPKPPTLPEPEEGSPCFIIQAKGPNRMLSSHVPSAVQKMHMCSRSAQRDMARGVLTNGEDWMFIILKIDANAGGTYHQSSIMSPFAIDRTTGAKAPSKENISFLSSILADWMNRCDEDLGDDDYFEYDTHSSFINEGPIIMSPQ